MVKHHGNLESLHNWIEDEKRRIEGAIRRSLKYLGISPMAIVKYQGSRYQITSVDVCGPIAIINACQFVKTGKLGYKSHRLVHLDKIKILKGVIE